MTRLGKIHNGYVKMNKHNQMMGFKWQGDLTINEKKLAVMGHRLRTLFETRKKTPEATVRTPKTRF